MRWFAALLALLVFGSLAFASPDEFYNYPEFRYLSALPGGGFGVTPLGRVGFDGAVQANIPVAYTPSCGNYMAGYWSASNEPRHIHIGTQGDNINGTGLLAAGFGRPGHGLYAAYMVTSRENEGAFNAQYQLTRDNWDKPALAIGLVDLNNNRDSSIARHQGGARSVYAVATGRLGRPDHFVYVTLGLGSGRFNNRLFGGVSWPASDKLTVYGEYDGWNVNAGLAVSPWSRFSERRWNLTGTFALIDLDRPEFGACLTWAPGE